MKIRPIAALAGIFMIAACSAPKQLSSSAPQAPLLAETVAPAKVLEPASAPAFLKQGDTIALIAPSYRTGWERVERAAEIIRGWGLNVVIGPNVDQTFAGSYAGTLEQREADLRWALTDPSIKGIICTRGGYGSIHYVGHMFPEDFAKANKWIVGYSDITTLHSMSVLGGVQSIHGPMGVSYLASGGEDLSSTLTRDLLFGTVPSYKVGPHPCNIPGKAEGVLVGGNSYTFFPLIGSDVDITEMDGIVLFMEEVEESYHGMDRIINMLRNKGVFEKTRAVILGEFTDFIPDLEYSSMEEMITSYLKPYGIPVLCGFPSGHDDDINVPLIMGAKVTVEVTEEGGTLSFSTEGKRKEIEILR